MSPKRTKPKKLLTREQLAKALAKDLFGHMPIWSDSEEREVCTEIVDKMIDTIVEWHAAVVTTIPEHVEIEEDGL